MRKNDRLPALRQDDALTPAMDSHAVPVERGQTWQERQVQRKFQLSRLVADADAALTAHVHQGYLEYQVEATRAHEGTIDHFHDIRAKPRINKAAKSDIEDMIDHTLQDTLQVGLERGRILADKGNDLLRRSLYPDTDEHTFLEKIRGK